MSWPHWLDYIMHKQELTNSFIRCKNSQDVPESYCGSCHHTLIAPSNAALEARERMHRCNTAQGLAEAGAWPARLSQADAIHLWSKRRHCDLPTSRTVPELAVEAGAYQHGDAEASVATAALP